MADNYDDEFERIMRGNVSDYTLNQTLSDEMLCRRIACKHAMKVLTKRIYALARLHGKMVAAWEAWYDFKLKTMTGEKALQINRIDDEGFLQIDSIHNPDDTIEYLDTVILPLLNQRLANVEYSLRNAKSSYVRLFGYMENTYRDDKGRILWNYVSHQQLDKILAL